MSECSDLRASVVSGIGVLAAICAHAVILTIGALVGSAPAEAAAGAFVVDDAEVEKPGACKVESWLAAAGNRDLVAAAAPACVVDLGKPVELQAAWMRFRSEGAWETWLVLKGKMNILPVGPGRIGLGLLGGPILNLLTGENAGSFFTVPMTLQLSEPFRINLNGGWLYERQEDLHFLTYGAGFEWNIVKRLTLIGEVFGLAGQRVEPRSRTYPRGQLGMRFMPAKELDIDLIYGRNILGEDASWLTLGLNVRFGTN